MKISGYIVDVIHQEIFSGIIEIEDNKIISIQRTDVCEDVYILPGLVDSHVHIESSMTIPSRFAQMVTPCGTVAVVSDPHEIANVLGREGVQFMIDDAAKVPLKCFFGVPSCVPATAFETSGSQIAPKDVDYLFDNGGCFLAEMMNFPGVIYDDAEVHEKLRMARQRGKRIDGHAPGLTGDQLKKYIDSGISTDHECSTLEEAIEKIKSGMLIQIREGSAARNFEALWTLIRDYPDKVMLCTDDSHPDLILQQGHVDRLIRIGLKKGLSIFDLYRAALLNPVDHYQIPVGKLQVGDSADFIIVNNLEEFKIQSTYINGGKVAENGEVYFDLSPVQALNAFNCEPIQATQLEIKIPQDGNWLRVMDAFDGELLTKTYLWKPNLRKGEVVKPDLKSDILKIVVVNRYKNNDPVVGYIRNFGLKQGAIAGSIAHDSHNIIAVGCDDASLEQVINSIIEVKGGISAFNGTELQRISLPIAGLMTDIPGFKIAKEYELLNDFVKEMGTKLKTPFMTLAFMSLLVIPSLKIGDKGLFDVNSFTFTDLFLDSKCD
ncbi:MAG: adenine deaminase [Marinilabiliaceae bacterium]|nr:adenine deaminase [Marinilabiliaceae bacterium]